jgi:hypothetical protein
MKALIGAGVTLFLVANLNAGGQFGLPDGSVVKDLEVREGTLSPGTLTIASISLETDGMGKVSSVFGPAPVLAPSDPHEYERVCFTPSEGSSPYLIFEGGGTELYSAVISAKKPREITGSCGKSPKIQGVKTDSGIRLGLTRSDLTKILGTPNTSANDWVVYSFEKYREYSDEEKTKMPLAPGGKPYKGAWHYHTLVGHFMNGTLDYVQIGVGGEPD